MPYSVILDFTDSQESKSRTFYRYLVTWHTRWLDPDVTKTTSAFESSEGLTAGEMVDRARDHVERETGRVDYEIWHIDEVRVTEEKTKRVELS